jgi:uncharacterized protein (DUF697 family)/predicted GTPase
MENFRIGDRVKSLREQQWQLAEVVRARDDGTYDLKWDDGEVSESCENVLLVDEPDYVERAIAAALSLNRANILVTGKTGVGKSTLLNSTFRQDLAQTGSGEPVTQFIREFRDPDGRIPFSIFDTPGLEIERYSAQLKTVTDFVLLRKSNADANSHIHCVWLCISEGSSRVEMAEQNLCKARSKQAPVIAVITKCRSDTDFAVRAAALLPEAKAIVRVCALTDTIQVDNPVRRIVVPSFGLDELVNVTTRELPAGHTAAFVAAQKVVLDSKKWNAQKCVVAGASASFAVGAIPLNFADAALLVPIQASMLAGITVAFGPKLDKGVIAGSASTTIAACVGTVAGRTATRAALALIPGVGLIASSILCGSTAAAITTAIGEAYIAVLAQFFREDPDGTPTQAYLIRALSQRLRHMWRGGGENADEAARKVLICPPCSRSPPTFFLFSTFTSLLSFCLIL